MKVGKIAQDEIGTEAEALAARSISQRGVQLVATAHGGELVRLIKNPTLSDLIGGIQTYACTLDALHYLANVCNLHFASPSICCPSIHVQLHTLSWAVTCSAMMAQSSLIGLGQHSWSAYAGTIQSSICSLKHGQLTKPVDLQGDAE